MYSHVVEAYYGGAGAYLHLMWRTEENICDTMRANKLLNSSISSLAVGWAPRKREEMKNCGLVFPLARGRGPHQSMKLIGAACPLPKAAGTAALSFFQSNKSQVI